MSASNPRLLAHFSAALTACLVGSFVIALLDALGAATSASLDAGSTALLAIYLVAFYSVLVSPAAVVLALIGRALPAERVGSPHAWASVFGAFAALVAVTYSTVLWTRQLFNNVELAALLAAVTAAVAAVLLFGMAALTAWLARTRGTAWAVGITWGVGGAVMTGWLVLQNESGFSQLSGWLLAIPVALTVVAAAAIAFRRRLMEIGRFGFVAPALVAACAFAAIAIEATSNAAADHAGSDAPLAHRLAPIVHYVSDFDDDGFSGLMGGGDCQPLNAEVAPGRFDIPGDGVDNNCVGGDAGDAVKPPKPTWRDVDDAAYDVVIVTVETLRADHVGFAGYERATTPNLDVIADESVVFERFYATSTYTRLSLPSLFTARPPAAIEWLKQEGSKFPRISEKNPWLPEAFANAGYHTASITADFPAFTPVDSLGFDRGFAEYDATAKLKYRGGTMRGFPSTSQLTRTKEWLAERDDKQRLFLWVHLFEPHYLYERSSSAPKFGKSKIDKYDAEIWMVDDAIGRLVEQLKDAGRWDRTILVVLGDHGEEFGEHGKNYHGSNLYEPQVRTPLLIRVPGLDSHRVSEAVSFVDVAPTLLNLAGIKEGFDRFAGRNLVGAMRGEPLDERPIVLEVWEMKTRKRYKSAIVSWPYKLVSTGTSGKEEALFDLEEDPAEKKSLLKKKKSVAESMRATLNAHRDASALVYR